MSGTQSALAPTTPRSALGYAPASGYNPTSFVPAAGAEPMVAAPYHQPGALGDFGRQVWASTVQMGEGVVGAVSAASRALGADASTVETIERARHGMSEHVRGVIEGMSPEAQATMGASLFGGTDRRGNPTPSPGEVGWGNYISATIASVVPTVVLAVLPGGVAGRAVAAIAGGAGRASAIAGAATTAGLFGSVQAGEAYGAFVDALDNASEQELSQSPVYQELRTRGMSDSDARREMVGVIAPAMAAMQFGIGAATGVGYSHLLTQGAVGAGGRAALARAGVGAAEGAALGAIQGGGGNLASQRAEIQAGMLQGYDFSDATATGAAGALGGALMGGAAGALHRPRPRAQPRPEPILPEERAALSALDRNDQPPSQRAAYDTLPGQPTPGQAEMFLPHTMGAGPRPGDPAGMPTIQPDMFGGQDQQITPQAPAWRPPEQTLTGAPREPVPPQQGALNMTLPEQRVPPAPTEVPPDMRRPPPEVPGQMDLPLDPGRQAPPTTPQRTSALAGEPPAARSTKQAPPASLSAPAAPAPAPRRPPAAPEQGVSKPAAPEQGVSKPAAKTATTVVVPKPEPKVDTITEPTVTVKPAPEPAPLEKIAAPKPEAIKPGVPVSSIDQAAKQAAEPASAAQAEAGNYKKGHTKIAGMDVAIENARGSIRRNKGDGPKWQVTMPAHYGYIKRTTGADGDHVDVYVGPRGKDAEKLPVWVVDQIDPKTGKFDEHKVMVGFSSKEAAQNAYDRAFSDKSGPTRRKAMTEMPMADFKEWLAKGDTRKEAAKHKAAEKPAITVVDAPAKKEEPPASKAEVKPAEAPQAEPPAKPQTVAEKLRARRAAEKARMAAAGERQRGQVASFGEEQPDTPPSAPDRSFDPEPARSVLEKEVVPLKAGADTKVVVDKMLREVEGLMALRTQDGAPVHQELGGALRAWIAKQPDRLPGTKTRPGDLADLVSRKIAGKPLVDTADKAAEARATMASTPKVVENERVARKAAAEEAVGDNVAADHAEVSGESIDESIALGEAAGKVEVGADLDAMVQDMNEAAGTQIEKAVGERSSSHDKQRIAADLLTAVRNGWTTVEAAAMHYGSGPAEGAQGRRRKHAEFADFVEAQLKHYDSPKVRAALEKKLAAAEAARAEGKPGNNRERQALTDAVDIARREWELTQPAALDDLRRMVEDLRKPEVKDAVAGAAEAKQAEKASLSAEAKAAGMPVSLLQKLRKAVGTMKGQAEVRAWAALDAFRARADIPPMPEIADRLGFKGRDWIDEHRRRMFGGDKLEGQAAEDAAKMMRAVEAEAERLSNVAQAEREAIARRMGVKLEDVDGFIDRLGDLSDKNYLAALDWVRANYGSGPRFMRGVAGDPGIVSKSLRAALMESVISNRPAKLHDLLRLVADDPAVQQDARELATLARALIKRTHNLDVVHMEESNRRAAEVGFEGVTPMHDLGIYNPHPDGIAHDWLWVNPYDPRATETLLHEAIHAATSRYLDGLSKFGDRHTALALIGEELQRTLARPDSLLLDRGSIKYALSDPHETLTMMMSNKDVQTALARTKATPEFAGAMEQLGFRIGDKSASLWDYFVAFVKNALGFKRGDVDATVLDYALRVGRQIIDEGAARNNREAAASGPRFRKATPEDPAGRALAESLRRPVESAARFIDPKGLGDRVRDGVLQASTTDNIVQWNRALFEPSDRIKVEGNPLVRMRTAMENIAAAARDYHHTYQERVSSLADRLRSPAGREVSGLMNDATLAEVRLGTSDPEANKHLTTEEQQARLAELQDRYGSLSEEAKQLYKDTRAHYEETYRAERKARLESIVHSILPGITDDEKKAVMKALRTRKGTEDLIADKSTEVADAFKDNWHAQRAMVRAVAQLHRMGFVQGDYFPLRREGRYVIRYGSADEGNYGVEMFESRREADARRAELAAEDVPELSQVMDKNTSDLRTILPDAPIVDQIERAAARNPELKGQAAAVRDAVNQVLLQYATRSERARTSLRRRGVQGAMEDPARVLAGEYLQAGYRMGHIQHGFERARALADMQMVVDDLGRHGAAGEQITASAVRRELEQRVAAGDDAQTFLGQLSRRATTLGYIQSLMSPSHMLTNTFEVHANATPLLGARHGTGLASLHLTRAAAQIAPKVLGQGARNFLASMGKGMKAADWRMAHYARDRFIAKGADAGHMARLFEALDRPGLIDHTQDRDLQNIANPSGFGTTVGGKLWQRFMDLNAAGVHAVDVMNKSAVAKAAFDLELRKTGDADKAIAYAVNAVRQVTPNYNTYNRPRISTGKGALGEFGAPIMQFKNFGLHMYGVLANLTKQSMVGASAAERREARLALAGVIATHAAAAGVVNTIADPLRYIGGAYDFITGTKPRDYQSDVRNFIADIFGPTVGEVISRGAPRAMGIDLSQRVGLGNMLAIPELESFDAKGFTKMVGLALMGAAGQDSAEIASGLGSLMRGDIQEGLTRTMPRVLRDALKAAQLSGEGVVTPKGQVILPRASIGAGDVFARAVGFQPAKVAEAREARNAMNTRMDEAKGDRARLMQRWMDAAPADRGRVMERIRAFNIENPGFTIKGSQLVQQLRNRGKANPSDFGLRVPPKAAADLRGSARFANVGRP